jgi:hypothetical protein
MEKFMVNWNLNTQRKRKRRGNQKPCDNCRTARKGCDEETPCSRCKFRGLTCERNDVVLEESQWTCDNCRSRHRRCTGNGQSSCDFCLKNNFSCYYINKQRGKKRAFVSDHRVGLFYSDISHYLDVYKNVFQLCDIAPFNLKSFDFSSFYARECTPKNIFAYSLLAVATGQTGNTAKAEELYTIAENLLEQIMGSLAPPNTLTLNAILLMILMRFGIEHAFATKALVLAKQALSRYQTYAYGSLFPLLVGWCQIIHSILIFWSSVFYDNYEILYTSSWEATMNQIETDLATAITENSNRIYALISQLILSIIGKIIALQVRHQDPSSNKCLVDCWIGPADSDHVYYSILLQKLDNVEKNINSLSECPSKIILWFLSAKALFNLFFGGNPISLSYAVSALSFLEQIEPTSICIITYTCAEQLFKVFVHFNDTQNISKVSAIFVKMQSIFPALCSIVHQLYLGLLSRSDVKIIADTKTIIPPHISTETISYPLTDTITDTLTNTLTDTITNTLTDTLTNTTSLDDKTLPQTLDPYIVPDTLPYVLSPVDNFEQDFYGLNDPFIDDIFDL